MTAHLQQLVDTFVDITNSQAGLSMDDASLRALLICCDAARLGQGAIIELSANREEYVVTATRTDIARFFDDNGPMLPEAWSVLESGVQASRHIDYSNLPTNEVAMTLRLIGAKAIHHFPVRRRGEVIGTLVLFDRANGVLSDDLVTYIQGVADAAMAMVDNERRVSQALDLVGQLSGALESRVLIEQAKGVISERYSLNQSEAFAWLRSLARNERGKLRDVAQRIVQSTAGDHLSPAGVPLHGDLTGIGGHRELS